MTLERKWLLISHSQTEWLPYSFSGGKHEGEPQVSLMKDVVAQTIKSKYLGLKIQSDGDIGEDVIYRLNPSWMFNMECNY